MKTCNKCGIVKPITEFYERVKGSGKYRLECKKCKERSKDPAKAKIRRKRYNDSHQDKIKAYTSNYYKTHKEQEDARHKKWFKDHPEKVKEYTRKQYYKDIEKTRAKNRKYNAKVRSTPEGKILGNIRRRINSSLKTARKSDYTTNLIGIPMDEFIVYIENLFDEEMSWDNCGTHGWHIDHIRPCSSFDLIDEKEQRKCFHYTNMQPLWAEDNLKKSDTWKGEYSDDLIYEENGYLITLSCVKIKSN